MIPLSIYRYAIHHKGCLLYLGSGLVLNSKFPKQRKDPVSWYATLISVLGKALLLPCPSWGKFGFTCSFGYEIDLDRLKPGCYNGHLCDQLVTNETMFNRPFDYILNTPAKVAVLRVLTGVTSPLTGRAIERLGDIAHAACLRALHELSIAKVVTFKQYGRERLYELNRKNKQFTEGLTALFRSEDQRQRELLKRIRIWLISRKSQVIQSSIYGSVARQEDRLRSDLDLLLIVNTTREKESLLEAWLKMEPEISENFSVTVSPYILTLNDFLGRYKASDPVVKSAVQEGYSLTERTLKELVYAKIKH